MQANNYNKKSSEFSIPPGPLNSPKKNNYNNSKKNNNVDPYNSSEYTNKKGDIILKRSAVKRLLNRIKKAYGFSTLLSIPLSIYLSPIFLVFGFGSLINYFDYALETDRFNNPNKYDINGHIKREWFEKRRDNLEKRIK